MWARASWLRPSSRFGLSEGAAVGLQLPDYRYFMAVLILCVFRFILNVFTRVFHGVASIIHGIVD